MDSFITSAARSLAAGDPLAALNRVALRNDPPAVALRGIAMAQLGDFERARLLLRKAARRFGVREALARARCQVAEAEVALAARDLRTPAQLLSQATTTLDQFGDHANAAHARLVAARRQLLVGDLDRASKTLRSVDVESLTASPALVARAELTRAELAIRRVQVKEATRALQLARNAGSAAGIPALLAEIDRVRKFLSRPSARLIKEGATRLVCLQEVGDLCTSENLIVDGCRRVIRLPGKCIALDRRPTLFVLVRTLAEAWPADVSRNFLIERAFQARAPNDSHRARLRVELGRLRSLLRKVARINATPQGFILSPVKQSGVVVLVPPIAGPAGSLLALLESGESWSTSALACALGSSQRTIQRELCELEEAGTVRAVGQGRSRRWLAPALAGFAPTLLLPGALPIG